MIKTNPLFSMQIFFGSLSKIRIILLLSCMQIVLNTCAESSESGLLKSFPKPDGNAEYLIQSDRIFLDSFGEEKVRTKALDLLRERCESSSLNDAHACYNLSVLLLQEGKKADAFQFAEMAHNKALHDVLYGSLYRTLGKQLGRGEQLKTDDFIKEFTKLEIACDKKEEAQAISIIEPMLVAGNISKSLLSNGSLAECFSPTQKDRLLKIAKGNTVNYTEIYYKQKETSDSYSTFWDTGYIVRGKKLEDYEGKQKLSNIWKEFRKAVRANDSVKAKNTLKEFLSELRSPDTKKKIDSTKLLSLERAAYLLIEQDKFFVSQKSLLQEF